MLFTSYEFIGFVLLVLLVYYLVPRKFQWITLLAASYVFYFIAGPLFVVYMLATTLSTWLCAKRIDQLKLQRKAYLKANKESMTKEERTAYKDAMNKRRHRWVLWGLLLNLGLLAVIKYTNFTISNINSVLAAFGSEKQLGFWNIAMPMGISFYIFQSLGYLIDVYREEVEAQTNPFKFALFVSFFPQLVQGPISRFSDLGNQLVSEHPFDVKNLKFGAQRVLWGFFKKVVIADRILVAVNELIHNPDSYTGAYVFAGMLFYALELYADFTGGIDITIGISEMLGISLKENFERPFFSKNIAEYWRRWHITMGTWFTDYIFYPISVCPFMLKLSKWSRAHLGEKIGKRVPVYLSSFIVWFATGIWHGASWNFIVWGLGNFVVIMISQELEPLFAKFHEHVHVQGTFGWRLFQVIRTVLLMSALRTFDCYRDVPLTFRMFGTVFTAGNWRVFFDGSMMQLGLSGSDYIILLIGLIVLICVSLAGRSGSVREKLAAKNALIRTVVWYGLFLAVLLFGAYGIGYDASQFIYNQF